jgi:type IV secretory pathway protease traF-like protein
MKENALRLALSLFELAKRYCFILLGLGLALMLFTSRYQLAINVTDSLPGTIFLIDKKDKVVSRGRYVAFAWKSAAPVPDGVTVIKRVAGIEGDQVTVINRTVFINAQKVGIAKTHSRTGEPLTVISEAIIPFGYFYATADHQDSFDSRYAKPGLISTSAVRGRAILLW